MPGGARRTGAQRESINLQGETGLARASAGRDLVLPARQVPGDGREGWAGASAALQCRRRPGQDQEGPSALTARPSAADRSRGCPWTGPRARPGLAHPGQSSGPAGLEGRPPRKPTCCREQGVSGGRCGAGAPCGALPWPAVQVPLPRGGARGRRAAGSRGSVGGTLPGHSALSPAPQRTGLQAPSLERQKGRNKPASLASESLARSQHRVPTPLPWPRSQLDESIRQFKLATGSYLTSCPKLPER